MLEFDEEKVLVNVRGAETSDLLDRITAFRAGLEPAAIPIIEAELRARGVGAGEIADLRTRYQAECLFHPDGTAMQCSFCRRPAVHCGWGWHRLLGLLPIFPRRLCSCEEHAPRSALSHPQAG